MGFSQILSCITMFCEQLLDNLTLMNINVMRNVSVTDVMSILTYWGVSLGSSNHL